MKWIALIVIVSVIALAVIIWKLIERLKSRQAEELEHQRKELRAVQNQQKIALQALRTIRDLQGDSAVDADIALEQINQLRDNYNQEGIAR